MCTGAPGWVQHYKVVPATNVYCSTWLSSTLQGRTSHECVLEHLAEFNTTRSYQPRMCTVAPGWVQHYKVVPPTNVYCSTWLSSTLQGRTSHKCVLEHLTEFNTTRSYQPQMCTVAPGWVQHYKVVPATNVYWSTWLSSTLQGRTTHECVL